jgi:hypothetical protein
VQVPYGEGVANHIDPESCAAVREDRREALTGECSTVPAVTAIGIDMGKNTLHMVGLDSRGAIVLREKVSRGRIALRI